MTKPFDVRRSEAKHELRTVLKEIRVKHLMLRVNMSAILHELAEEELKETGKRKP